jgi:hypothetical protein
LPGHDDAHAIEDFVKESVAYTHRTVGDEDDLKDLFVLILDEFVLGLIIDSWLQLDDEVAQELSVLGFLLLNQALVEVPVMIFIDELPINVSFYVHNCLYAAVVAEI